MVKPKGFVQIPQYAKNMYNKHFFVIFLHKIIGSHHIVTSQYDMMSLAMKKLEKKWFKIEIITKTKQKYSITKTRDTAVTGHGVTRV